MLYTIVSVFDSGVGAFMRPWFVRSKGEGVRMFTDETNRKDGEANALKAHPADYALFFLGVFDDSNGRITGPDMPEKLTDATSVVL